MAWRTYLGIIELPRLFLVLRRVARASSWESVRCIKMNSLPFARRREMVLRTGGALAGGALTRVLRRHAGLAGAVTSSSWVSLMTTSSRVSSPGMNFPLDGAIWALTGEGELASRSPRALRDGGVAHSESGDVSGLDDLSAESDS